MGKSVGGSYFHNPGTEPLRYVTVGDVILETAERWPDRPAVRSVHQDKTISYAELMRQVCNNI